MRSDDDHGSALSGASRGKPHLVMGFAHDTRSPRRARAAIGGFLDDPFDPIAPDVMLVASELVSNVVRHTNVGGTLRVWDPKPDVPLRLEVADDDPNLPRAVSPHDGGGRGLHIVHEVSDAWGSEREGVGKVIWVEFDRSQRH